MTSELTLSLAKLRTCVAFMGEKDQANWWPSSFLSRSGEAFLSPVFPKTVSLARINGASGAAKFAHDEHIGIGDVYHLFRLPESVEQDISQFWVNDGSILEQISSEENAKQSLQELSSCDNTQGIGPLLIEHEVIDQRMIARIAAAYLKGFSTGEQVYPYYRSKA